MNTQHTPGPWSHEYKNGLSKYFSQFDRQRIFAVEHNEASILESEANARLIAAAPELLEALQELLNLDPHAVDISARINAEAKAKAAIRKATNQ